MAEQPVALGFVLKSQSRRRNGLKITLLAIATIFAVMNATAVSVEKE
jgi:hypothetical protein